MTTAAHLLRSARRTAGLSQRALAGRVALYQPHVSSIENGAQDTRVDKLSRLLGAAGYRLVALPTRSASAAEAAEVIFDALAGPGGEDRAFRALIGLSDALAAESDSAVRVALCAAEPAPTGDARFDAAIAAVVEHHLSRLPVPTWTSEPGRFLADPWVVDRYAGADIAERTPPAFLHHGVHLAASELASV